MTESVVLSGVRVCAVRHLVAALFLRRRQRVMIAVNMIVVSRVVIGLN